MSQSHEQIEPESLFVLPVVLTAEQVEALARRVAKQIEEGRDDGFLDVKSAAEFLATTPKAIYHLVERDHIPHQRKGGRLLFDRAELRAWGD